MYDILKEANDIVEREFAKTPCVFCEKNTQRRCDVCQCPTCVEHLRTYQGLYISGYRCVLCDEFIKRTAAG